MKVVEALNRGLREALEADERVHFLGEDILDPYGGAFKVAEGLSTTHPDRVHTTPVSEAGMVGLGVGMALRGLRPVVEIMFGDFITLGTDQLVNHAAKLRWMSADQVQVPLVVRTPMGGRRGYGPTHSQTLEKMYLGVPGLRVVAASALGHAGRLLRTAILEDPDPVLFVEHKLLYGLPILAPEDPMEFEVDPFDDRYPAWRLRIRGAPDPALTVAAYGHMAELAREAILRLAYEREIFAELIVFTQLSPLKPEPLIASLERTGRLLTVEEGTRRGGWGAEVAADAGERLPAGLVMRRVAALDLPVPAAGPLEETMLPGVDDVMNAAAELAPG